MRFENLAIRLVQINGSGPYSFENCCVSTLNVGEAFCDLTLTNCWIGDLWIHNNSFKALRISNGSIRNIECPLPNSQDNPFGGLVAITDDVNFPVSPRSRLLKGAQGYRNVRAHLEKIENGQASNLMRALELARERYDDRGLIKYVNWAYGYFAKHETQARVPNLLDASALSFCRDHAICIRSRCAGNEYNSL